MKYHLVGIAGSGMSALAQLIRRVGHEVSGSDRSFDRGQATEVRDALVSLGIKIFPQDGSGVEDQTHRVIFSTAVEKDNTDLAKALEHNIPLVRRAKLVAELFDKRFGIAISGTSGKSTVAGMIATMLRALGMDPTFYGGAGLAGVDGPPALANAMAGGGDFFCAETDESDGSFLEFHPKITVVTNISKDHKSLEEITGLFLRFMEQTEKTLVLNADCPVTRGFKLPAKETIWFGCDAKRFPLVIKQQSIEGTAIEWKGIPCYVRPAGIHNVSNALATLTMAEVLKIPLAEAARGLETYRGIHRRLELVRKTKGIWVFDDFAHNPVKIEATLTTLQSFFPRVLAVFQLHGFGPARAMKEELAQLFSRMLRKDDRLLLPEIYDVGGTADRSIRTEHVVEAILKIRKDAPVLYARREEIPDHIGRNAKPGGAVVVMGARDPSLPELCRQIIKVAAPLLSG